MSSVAGTSSSIGRGPRKQHVKKTSKRTAGSQKRSPTRHRTKRPPARRPTKRAAAPQRTKRAPEEHALLAFAELATRLGLRWYVFGAQAVNLHGFPRATADLDITVELAGLRPAALVAKLADAGFSARFTDEAFIAATRVLPIVHDATHLPIDLVLAGPGLEQRFLDEVVAMPIGGKTVFVMSPENLIVTKLLAGRRSRATASARATAKIRRGSQPQRKSIPSGVDVMRPVPEPDSVTSSLTFALPSPSPRTPASGCFA